MKEFDIDIAIKTHGIKYDYSLVNFESNYKKVKIVCKRHGVFEQTPRKHLIEGRGCRCCQYDKLRNMYSFNLEDFIKTAKEVHGDLYDYSKVEYVNSGLKVKIHCSVHGEFEQNYEKHVSKKQGCPKCKGRKISHSRRDTLIEFIDKSKLIHGTKYDYSKVEYVNMHTKVYIICPNHGKFLIKPSNHIFCKNGCPNCGYNISKPEKEWLDSLNVASEFRQKVVTIDGKRYKTDAYDKSTKTVYEFFGYFWHGHPDYFSQNDIHPKVGKTFGEIYQKTLDKIKHIQDSGYNLVYVWG